MKYLMTELAGCDACVYSEKHMQHLLLQKYAGSMRLSQHAGKQNVVCFYAPILVPPRDEGRYVLDTDASDHALGAVLQQEQDGRLCVIGYASRTLTPAERRYCITRKEHLGVVYGLKKYRQHLLGRKIVVRTDHAALTFLMKTPEPVGQQGRWLDLLAEYHIDIKHRPGHVHSNSDALSRRPCERSGGQACQQCLR